LLDLELDLVPDSKSGEAEAEYYYVEHNVWVQAVGKHNTLFGHLIRAAGADFAPAVDQRLLVGLGLAPWRFELE